VRWRVYAAVGALLLVLVVVRVEGGLIWADTLVARARTLDRAGQWKESIELYDRALALIPWQATWWRQFRAESFYNLACVLPEGETDLKAELLEAADRSLTRARHLEPLELEHYSNSGVLHAYWSDAVDPAHLGTAITFYQQAFRLAPTRAELRADLGHTYHNHGLYEKALEQYKIALEIDPQFAIAYYDSGLAWLALDRPDLARETFSAALELAPDCDVCWEALQALDE
jgi:tetratricopeptide (TPR) repeat protein